MVLTAKDVLDRVATGNGRISHEGEFRRALEAGLCVDRTLDLGASLGQDLRGAFTERIEVDHRRAHVGRRLDTRHGQEAEPLVSVAQAHQLLEHNSAQVDIEHLRCPAPPTDDTT